ncbi:MAG TPA: CheR family methyltransferase [Geomonas sp.]|nr:CheR family methyltransferase [Geomonas sp.]
MDRSISDSSLSTVSAFLAREMGLLFPRERWDDLERGLIAAARQLGFMDLHEFLRWLMSAPLTRRQVEALAGYLTIGETYFFRDARSLEATETTILPALLRARRGKDQRLRIWSAGCSTGEEAYTLAILLHRLLPDLKDWNISILATDINAAALKKGMSGVYGKWSFRATPSWFKTLYFIPQAEGSLRVVDNVKRMVNFEYLNLAEDSYPSLPTNTNAMDLVFCRNVLMYFAPEMARTVVAKLNRCLVDLGWLVLGAAETLPRSFMPFEQLNLDGSICYRKRPRDYAPPAERETGGQPAQPRSGDERGVLLTHELVFLWQGKPEQEREAAERARAARGAQAGSERGGPDDSQGTAEKAPPAADAGAGGRQGAAAFWQAAAGAGEGTSGQAAALFRQGLYPQAAALLSDLGSAGPLPGEALTLLIRSQANQGKLPEALAICEEALLERKLDPALHLLRAEILQEQGRASEASHSLRHALYLDPKLVLAHFALGNLTLWSGRAELACRHFHNALALLDSLDPDAVVPGSEGMTAGRLREIIGSMEVCAGRDRGEKP